MHNLGYIMFLRIKFYFLWHRLLSKQIMSKETIKIEQSSNIKNRTLKFKIKNVGLNLDSLQYFPLKFGIV